MRVALRVTVVHRVYGIDVRRGLVHEALARAVDHDAAGQAALGEAEVRPAGQRYRRAPPGVVHEVERRADGLARGYRVAGVAGEPVVHSVPIGRRW